MTDPRDTAAPIRNGQSVGRYEIVEEFGRGGMDMVYRVRDASLKRDVAIKFDSLRTIFPQGRQAL